MINELNSQIEAYIQGYDAYEEGKSFSDNPYSLENEQRWCWGSGWSCASLIKDNHD